METGLGWMVLRLLLAAVLGGAIGYEREAHGRPAGLRTHMLVCLGATLFTVVSEHYSGARSDPSRIASQIVSGIGFLGAGTIIRQGSVVRGLTTAASLWTVAAIGMAVGAGGNLIYLAIVASFVVFVTLSVISPIEHAMITRRERRDLVLSLTDRETVTGVLSLLQRLGAEVSGVESEEVGPGVAGIRLHLRIPAGRDVNSISVALTALPEVRSFDWE